MNQRRRTTKNWIQCFNQKEILANPRLRIPSALRTFGLLRGVLQKKGLGLSQAFIRTKGVCEGHKRQVEARRPREKRRGQAMGKSSTRVMFRTVILFDGESPRINWDPRLASEEEAKRVYTIYGREKLEEGGWTTPTNALHRFFRVGVEMR